MKTCTVCNNEFNDGAQCTICKKELDFACAGISEAGWRKLGANRRSQWKCTTCSTLSPAAKASNQATLETVLSEIRDMKRQLLNLPTLVDDIRSIKEEMSEVKAACDFSCNKLDELSSRVSEVETKVLDLQRLHEKFNYLQSDLERTKHEISTYDQRSRLSNVEIKGVPFRREENPFSIMEAICRRINYTYAKSQINYISRVPTYNSKEKLLVISFLNRYAKDDFISAARLVKDLNTADIGFHGSSHRLYINDHLSPEHKKLLSKTKIIAKDKKYLYVWIKHGKIHVLKDNNSKVIIIRKEQDLNKLT